MKQGCDVQNAATQAITLTVAQAATYVGVSTKTIYRAVEDGRLKAAALGRSGGIRIRPEWIDEWIDGDIYLPKEQPARPSRRPYAQAAARQQPRRGFLHP
ncbi:MAG: helix-turn-helix domain-containing protein [Actinobacteria bacterium]|nr:helix-turn-helix domain-containing protein [Actinomycetota bacterium]